MRFGKRSETWDTRSKIINSFDVKNRHNMYDFDVDEIQSKSYTYIQFK
jgi:hypothetical protein